MGARSTVRTAALLAVLGAAAPVTAADFTVQPVTLDVPAGFEGPIRQAQQGATVVGFTRSSGPTVKTLLQVTLYDASSQPNAADGVEPAAAASRYLLDFAGGVERRRSDFKRTEPTALTISELPAARLQWTGKLHGIDTVGVMYCFLAGSKIVSFHTQDLGSAPTEGMNEVIKAFEAARVKKAAPRQ